MKKCSKRNGNNFNENFKKVDEIIYCEKHYQQSKKKERLNEKKNKIFGKGINDMPFGWICLSKNNKKIYQTWSDMLKRCYSEKYHKNHPSYKGCYVCKKWLKLSGFIDDLQKIDGYDQWIKNIDSRKMALDKDIKSDNQNKCYCLEECTFVTITDNSKQSAKHQTKEYCSNKIVQLDKNMNLINEFCSSREAEKNTGISRKYISYVCKGLKFEYKGYIWMYKENYELYKKIKEYQGWEE